MSRPLKSFDVSSITTISKGISILKNELLDLKSIARDTDFGDEKETLQFSNNIIFLKTYYDRLEVLIRARINQQATSGKMGRRPNKRTGKNKHK